MPFLAMLLSLAGLLQELLAQEMADKKDIEDEIEEDRRKVDAHTPITLEVRPAPLLQAAFPHLAQHAPVALLACTGVVMRGQEAFVLLI